MNRKHQLNFLSTLLHCYDIIPRPAFLGDLLHFLGGYSYPFGLKP